MNGITYSVCARWRTIEHGQTVCVEYRDQTVTTMPKRVEMWVVNVPFDGGSRSEAGAMTATVECNEPAGEGCGMCQKLGVGLMVAKLIAPELLLIWGPVEVAVKAGCAGRGC